LGTTRALAWACYHLSAAHYWVGDYEPADTAGRESRALFEHFDESMGIAACHKMQGMIALAQGDLPDARRHFERLRDHYLNLGSQPGIAESYLRLGDVERVEGDGSAAEALYQRALSIAREVKARDQVAASLTGLGRMALGRGDAKAAASRFVESLSIDRDWHNPVYALPGLEGLAGALTLGAAGGLLHSLPAAAATPPELLCAARLFGAVEAVRDRIGSPRPPFEQTEQDARIAMLRASLGDDRFITAWEAGRALSWEEMMACALDDAL
jgi:tetratricopeptide (TPR) repeat protein